MIDNIALKYCVNLLKFGGFYVENENIPTIYPFYLCLAIYELILLSYGLIMGRADIEFMETIVTILLNNIIVSLGIILLVTNYNRHIKLNDKAILNNTYNKVIMPVVAGL